MPDEKQDPEATKSIHRGPVSAPEQATVGPYRLLQKIGQGGMGEVWEALQLEPVRRTVAVKIIKHGMDTEQVVARFEAERQALAIMNHPNVAKVFDAGQTPRGRPFFAMEYVKGDPITVYADRHRLSTRERLQLVIQVCEGVQHAHQKGIIHRDLKPSNILVTVDGGRPTPKIIDFGVAKATNQHLTERTLFTELGQLIGTPEYMSPEQAEMAGVDIDTRTDVYSLGVVLYELLAGALPFDSSSLRGAGLAEIQRRIREDEPPRPSTRLSSLGGASNQIAEKRRTEASTLVRRLRGDLDWITMMALDKDRTRRYASPADLAADLHRHLQSEPVVAASPTAAYRLRKFVRRHKLGVASAAALALVLLAGVVGTSAGLVRAVRAEAAAVEARDEAVGERDRAQQAREEVEEVVEFMVELFENSDPWESPGSTMTAREILDRGAERIETELEDQPLTKARLRETLGSVYQSLGQFDLAERQKRAALESRSGELGDEHVEVARSLDGLSSLAYAKADYEASERLSRQSLSIYRKRHGDEHVDVANALVDVGVALHRQGDLESAETMLREALALVRRLPDADDGDLEACLGNLANVLVDRGEHEQAESLYQESLALTRKIHGPEHPAVATALDNLAIFYDFGEDPERAEPLYRDSLSMLRRVYGEEHPEVAQTMGNLADFLIDRGEKEDLREAEDLLRKSLEMNREFRPEHPFVADNLCSLAEIRHLEGDNLEAQRLVRQALGIYRKKLSEQHPKTVDARGQLGKILLAQGSHAEAESILLDVYEGLVTRDASPPDLQWALEQIVKLYEAWGKPQKTAEYRSLMENLPPVD